MNNKNYIMPPQLFDRLGCVHGFNNINGKTCMEHITIIKPDISAGIKKEILKFSSPEKDLEMLSDNNIPYTHKFLRE